MICLLSLQVLIIYRFSLFKVCESRFAFHLEIDCLIIRVMINDTIMKYENKEKHQIYVETFTKKKPQAKEKASL